MNRLNDRIADNRERRTNLENENINIESEFIEKLKDMEKESVYLEVFIFYKRLKWIELRMKKHNYCLKS